MAKTKKSTVPAKVISNLESTLRKAKRDRWAVQGDIWDLEKWVKWAKEGKSTALITSIRYADTDLRERLSMYVWDWTNQ